MYMPNNQISLSSFPTLPSNNLSHPHRNRIDTSQTAAATVSVLPTLSNNNTVSSMNSYVDCGYDADKAKSDDDADILQTNNKHNKWGIIDDDDDDNEYAALNMDQCSLHPRNLPKQYINISLLNPIKHQQKGTKPLSTTQVNDIKDNNDLSVPIKLSQSTISLPIMIDVDKKNANIPCSNGTNPDKHKHKNTVIVNMMKSKSHSRLDKFNGDILSYNVWLRCCNINNKHLVSFDVLYVELMKIWKEKTKCQRIPTMNELRSAFNKFCLYKNFINQKEYVLFWEWFTCCCSLINEIKHLWDVNQIYQARLNLLCDRKQTEKILKNKQNGTFILRISSSVNNSLVISYVDDTQSIKHTVLIRNTPFQYIISSKKHNKLKQTSLSQLIRSFVKLKYIYCTKERIFPKNALF